MDPDSFISGNFYLIRLFIFCYICTLKNTVREYSQFIQNKEQNVNHSVLYRNYLFDTRRVIIGNSIKYVAFYRTHSGLGLLISTAHNGSYITVANDDSSLIGLDYKFPSSKSDCTILNKWHVISLTWSNNKDLSNCWSNGEKLMTFNTGNTMGTDHCIIGNINTPSDNTHLIGCIGEIIGFYRSLTDKEISNIHRYLMKKWGITD